MWKKIAFYRLPEQRPEKAVSHAQLPTALILDSKVRVFFASRDRAQISSVYFVDLLLKGPKAAFGEFSKEAALTPGDIGTFDEHGVFPSSIARHNGRYFMYYIGWTKGVEPPLFYAAIGLAVSREGRTFEKRSASPVMGRSDFDPCLVTSPHIYREKGLWRMNYVSGVKWTREPGGKLQSHYHIKYADSEDGLHWNREGRVAIDFLSGETNIARPTVLKDRDGIYKMWFCYVHSSIGKYRIGFARSHDGYRWKRRDGESGIDVDDQHAKEMICYPCVFVHGGRKYMLYNGDNFGQEGFGIAVWE